MTITIATIFLYWRGCVDYADDAYKDVNDVECDNHYEMTTRLIQIIINIYDDVYS